MSNMHINIAGTQHDDSVADTFISGEDLKSARCRIEIERKRERIWLAKAIGEAFEPITAEQELEALISA